MFAVGQGYQGVMIPSPVPPTTKPRHTNVIELFNGCADEHLEWNRSRSNRGHHDQATQSHSTDFSRNTRQQYATHAGAFAVREPQAGTHASS